MAINQLALLATRRFLPLFITQLLGAYNDNVVKAALVMLITYQLVHDPTHAQLLINAAGGIFILPFVLFSALSGQLADKFDRCRLVRIIKVIEILVVILAILGFYFEHITLLMVALFLMGTHSTFYGPVKYSALPDLLQREELLAGNGVVEGSTFIAILIGTIVGTLYGITREGALTVTLISLVLAFVGWMSSFFLLPMPRADAGLRINFNLTKEIGHLLRYTYQNSTIYAAIMQISWFWFLGFIYVTEFPVFTKAILGAGASVVTWFLVLFSLGIAAGAFLCNRLLCGKIHSRFVALGMLAMTVFTLDLCWASAGFTPPKNGMLLDISAFHATFAGWRISIDLFFLALAGGIYIVPLYAILQTHSEADHRSRIIASNNIFGALFMVVAAVFAMLLSTLHFTAVGIYLCTAIINVFVALYAWKRIISE